MLTDAGYQGLGYYATQQLAASGKYHVIIGSRSIAKAEAAIQSLVADTSYKVEADDLEALEIDVDSDSSIQAAVDTVKQRHGHLDILLANAGIAQAQAASADGSGPSLRELYQAHFNTNLFGAVISVDAFLPLLRASTHPQGKRVAFTSSGLASISWAVRDKGKPMPSASAKNWPIYRSTKTAMSMIVLHYTELLEEEGFVVSAADPGYCECLFRPYAYHAAATCDAVASLSRS